MSSSPYSIYQQQIDEYEKYLRDLQYLRRHYYICSPKFRVMRTSWHYSYPAFSSIQLKGLAGDRIYLCWPQLVSVLVGYGDIVPNRNVDFGQCLSRNDFKPTQWIWYYGLDIPKWVKAMPELKDPSARWRRRSFEWLHDETFSAYRSFWEETNLTDRGLPCVPIAPTPHYRDKFKEGSTWAQRQTK